MKKLLFVLVTVCLFSCSSDDSSETVTNQLNPPSWIHGKWIQYIDDISTGLGYEFKPNDVCFITSATTTCYSNPALDFEEESDDNSYTLAIISGSSTTLLKFNKVSPTRIRLTAQDGQGVSTYFDKQ